MQTGFYGKIKETIERREVNWSEHRKHTLLLIYSNTTRNKTKECKAPSGEGLRRVGAEGHINNG